VNAVETALDKSFGVQRADFSSSSVGPTFGQEIARTAVIAIIASLVLISIYIGLRFEFKFAVPVLIALAHDLLITAGVYALFQREVSTSTVAALLTILGFSLYDTIIVFDRIRENVPRMPRATFSQIVNRSMSEVVVRSLVTSFSTLLPILALMLFGGATLKDFGFALLVGVASGAYSSIFIAAPVLTHWKEREPVYKRRTAAALQEHGGVIPAYADGSIADVEPAPGEKRGRRRIAPRPGTGGTPPREPATAGGPSPAPSPAPAPSPSRPASGAGSSTSTSGVSSAAAARRAARRAAAAEAAESPASSAAETEPADGPSEPSEGNGQAPERESRDPQAATDDKSSDKPINRRRKKHGRSR
jgi:SecD/SecF fusion protein